jgi:UBX domain-containing protein 1/4
LNTSGNNIEQAMEFLLAHADEDDAASASIEIAKSSTTEKTDESLTGENKEEGGEASSATAEAKSIKCEDCGRLFRTQVEVEFHAAKSGHLNFSESTEEKKPLTEEEKKAQLALLEEKMKQKRTEREQKEREETLEKERLRIKSGKDMTEIKRKMEEDEMKKIVRFKFKRSNYI